MPSVSTTRTARRFLILLISGPEEGGLVRGQPLNIKALLLFVKDAYENEGKVT